ncbi:MAG: Rrf2 family transcriptional regulator [Bacteroidia bacterium]
MFSKTSKYAIRVILYLATREDPEQKMGAKTLAETLDIPVYFLAKVLQDLARKGVISSNKGPGGGFYLNEENLKNTIADVLTAVEGTELFSGCVLGFPTCSEKNPCPLHTQVFTYREGLRYQLSHISIIDMADRISRNHLKI